MGGVTATTADPSQPPDADAEAGDNKLVWKVSSSLDFANLAEEVESIGRRDVRDAKQRLRQVITGLRQQVGKAGCLRAADSLTGDVGEGCLVHRVSSLPTS